MGVLHSTFHIAKVGKGFKSNLVKLKRLNHKISKQKKNEDMSMVGSSWEDTEKGNL